MTQSLEDRIEALEERVAYLEGELGLSIELTRVADVAELGMMSCAARAALALHDAGGRVLSPYQILDAVPSQDGNDERDTLSMVHALVSKIRKALGAGAVATAWGLGYRITPAGSARLSAALERSL